jgi:hypothetical protein
VQQGADVLDINMDDGLIDGVAAMTKFVNLCIAGARACAWAAGCMQGPALHAWPSAAWAHAASSTQPPAALQHAAASAAAACRREGRSMRPAARPAALP